MNDPIVTDARGSVADAVQSLERELSTRGIQIFARIDHAGGARAVGLELADEVVLVFGNPAVGTSLMQQDPIAGLDLPLRMLVWDENGRTRVAFHDPRDLVHRYELVEHAGVLDKLHALLVSLAASLGG